MKLRTRLFLSISALVTVALLGLLLGLVSVLQMATVQQRLVRDTTHALEIGLKLRQNLGEQLTLILDDETAPENLRLLQDNFQALLNQGLDQGGERTGFSKASSNYQAFLQAYRDSPAPSRSMGLNNHWGRVQPGPHRPDRFPQAGLGAHHPQRGAHPRPRLAGQRRTWPDGLGGAGAGLHHRAQHCPALRPADRSLGHSGRPTRQG